MRGFNAVTRDRKKLLLSAAGLAAIVAPLAFGLTHATAPRAQAQGQDTFAIPPEFKYEVASIKPNEQYVGGLLQVNARETPDGYIARNILLVMLLNSAYGQNGSLKEGQLLGAPDWVRGATFEIDAKMDAIVADDLKKLSFEKQKLVRQHMMQALLEDRFKLKVHRETRELPVYLLEVSKPGKLQQAKLDCVDFSFGAPPPATSPDKATPEPCDFSVRPGHIDLHQITMAQLANLLPIQLQGTVVIDRTDLAGRYDVKFDWASDQQRVQPPASPGAPALVLPDVGPTDLLSAIHDQLGLKLVSGKAPIGVVVIDHIEKPSGN
jgi:uncharacterized protein (TIGR03435 family)